MCARKPSGLSCTFNHPPQRKFRRRRNLHQTNSSLHSKLLFVWCEFRRWRNFRCGGGLTVRDNPDGFPAHLSPLRNLWPCMVFLSSLYKSGSPSARMGRSFLSDRTADAISRSTFPPEAAPRGRHLPTPSRKKGFDFSNKCITI